MKFIADVHPQFSQNKTKNREDQVLIQNPFETMSKSYVFWPDKGGTPQKHFSYFCRDFLSTLESGSFGPW